MCNCNSNYTGYRQMVVSNFSNSELRQQCANEYQLNVNDPGSQATIDACVQAKKGQKADNVVGWIQSGSNLLANLGNVIGAAFGSQQAAQDLNYIPPANEPKKIGPWGWVGIIAGLTALGFGVYYLSKPKK